MRRAADDSNKMSGEALNGFRITHPQRIVDQESGVTKLNVAEYYFAIANTYCRIFPIGRSA